MAKLTPLQERSRLRFDISDDAAETAIHRVAARRTEQRIALREAGNSFAWIDARRDGLVAALASQLPLMNPWPYREGDWDGDYRDSDYQAQLAADIVILRSIVWELRRDYDEWPDWEDVACRVKTWLDIDFDDGCRWANRATTGEAPGLIAAFPSHLYSRTHNCASTADWKWRVTEPFMIKEETKFQWRLLLGEAGLQYRAALSLLLDDLPVALPL